MMTALHFDQQPRAPNSSHLAGTVDANSVPNRRREANIRERNGGGVVPRRMACHVGFLERWAREAKGEDAAREEGGHGRDRGA